MKRIKDFLIVAAIFASGLFVGAITGGTAALVDVVNKTFREGPVNVRRLLVQRARHDLQLDEEQAHQFWQILNETGAELRETIRPVRPQIEHGRPFIRATPGCPQTPATRRNWTRSSAAVTLVGSRRWKIPLPARQSRTRCRIPDPAETFSFPTDGFFRSHARPMSDQFDVRYVAQLARLDLSEAEIAKFQSQLGQVLAHVEKLGQVDVSGVEPTAHANEVVNVFRADEPRDWFTSAELCQMRHALRTGSSLCPR